MNNLQQLFKKLNTENILLEVVDDELKIFSKSGTIENDIITQIKIHKSEIIQQLKKSTGLGAIKIPVAPKMKNYPLSNAQQRLWMISKFKEASIAYNIPMCIPVKITDVTSFKKALQLVVARHEILRTIFKEDIELDEVRQWIIPAEEVALTIEHKDLRKMPAEDKQHFIKEYAANDALTPFNLESDLLFRATLLQITEDDFVLSLTMHHIISDEWSVEVMFKDVMEFYKADTANKEPKLSPLRIQYKEYTLWQLSKLKSEVGATQKKFWLAQLSGELPVLDLPSNKKRPLMKTYNGHSFKSYLSKETTADIKKFSQKQESSLFIYLVSISTILLHKYTVSKDIIVGTPISERNHVDLKDQIGFYINTLVLRNQVDSNKDFIAFYDQIKASTLVAYEHSDYPFDSLIENLGTKRDISRNPIFDIMLTMQDSEAQETEFDATQTDTIWDNGACVSKFDVSLTFKEEDGYLSYTLDYNTDVYDKKMIQQFMRHFKSLLKATLDNSTKKIANIEYLSKEEQNYLLYELNNTKTDYPKNNTIVELFDEQVQKTPNDIALVYEEKQLTYQEVNKLSNQIANYIHQNYAPKPDEIIAIHLERSEWLIVAILGILKTGAAYVPIDFHYPKDRIEYMMNDSQAKAIINQKILEDFIENKEKYKKTNSKDNAKENNLAYVIYTSGSTGKPKGVMIENRSLINYNEYFTKTFKISNKDSSVMSASISFDGVLTAVFGCLLSGATLHIVKEDLIVATDRFIDYLIHHKISFLKGTPILLNLLINNDKFSELLEKGNLKLLISGGDNAIFSDIKQLVNIQGLQIINHFGPTESTIGATVQEINADVVDRNNVIAIGSPISNTQLYILGENNDLLPEGVVGEICISGDGLARGYINNPKLTAEKFIQHPFLKGQRLYKTGDFGQWLSDKSIKFSGRKDDQVKVRGYRIELGEIEKAISTINEIKQCVVIAKNSEDLVAYYICEEIVDEIAIRTTLMKRLPAYMIPNFFVKLKEFPLNANLKIDKKQLPNPQALALEKPRIYVAPSTKTERELVAIWEELFNIENIGIEEDFFLLGGQSILGIKLISRIHKRLGVHIELKDIFSERTIASIAEYIETSIQLDAQEIEEETERKLIF
ncbi:Plipastatin synthase subunit C [Kordia antarctica]|uniref:Plipastatin synthase subunit C n=1 Tax=Kordia antarctica TaxID=1218801 RepID=A0A7L4ZG56_9FLAO|nr:non-ribosomal peptide synthetase [Kordia antarctica]QHI35401.1 Plipastatin synthase subunit C [Kordia antarctica]